MNSKKRTWVFYYLTERQGDKIVIGFIDCIRPERTNLRKEQKYIFGKTSVIGTGYTTDANEPDLVYPHSKLENYFPFKP